MIPVCTQVSFENRLGLHVSFETKRLMIRSVLPDDVENYVALFGDKEVMNTFSPINGSDLTRSREEMVKAVQEEWVKAWAANDAYSGLAVLKKDTGEFIGHVRISQGNGPGKADLVYLFHKKYWNQGFGKEVAAAVVHVYLPATIQRGYRLHGFRIEEIEAQIRRDNKASKKIVKFIGMRKKNCNLRETRRADYYTMSIT